MMKIRGLLAILCLVSVTLLSPTKLRAETTIDVHLSPPPWFTELTDSRPLALEFTLDTVQSNDECSIEDQPLLYALEYEIYVKNPNNTQISTSEYTFFFSDRIDLFGRPASGSLHVQPGIYVPLNDLVSSSAGPMVPLSNFSEVHVEATLSYQRILLDEACNPRYVDADTEVDFDLSVRPEGSAKELVYNRMRDGYLRRHLLDIGRGLSWTYLKEYDPEADSKELLFHSRTFTAGDGYTRVYVPWIRECEEGDCGDSVETGSQVVYGAAENPLLRGGLAMATFALEYLSDPGSNAASLQHALKLFEYVERSEWIDKDGKRTGFFLRSRWPGNEHDKIKKEYWFASIDEIVGMTLGLLYLDRAVEVAGDEHNRQLVEDLADRLGNQLKDNYYLILPLKKVGNTWEGFGLPLERHTGWSGGYPLQWYLERGFRAINPEKNYRPSSELKDGDDFWKQVDAYDLKTDDDGIIHAIRLGLNPEERALLAPIGTGFAMWNNDKDFKWHNFCIDKISWSWEQIPGQEGFDGIPIPIPEFKRFNFAMLLHAFQLGMAEANREGEGESKFIKELRKNFAVLIKGVLNAGGGSTREIKLYNVLGYVGGAVGGHFKDPSAVGTIGSP